jgi:hypothetical protein
MKAVGVKVLKNKLSLASIEFLRGLGQKVELASYDERLIGSARALGVAIAAL